MTWDLSDGQNISKKILKKELSYKISTKVLKKVFAMVKCFVTLLLLLCNFGPSPHSFAILPPF